MAVSGENHWEVLVWLVLNFICACHVFRDCRRIGEPASLNVSGTLILGPLFYLPWIFWWPGSVRRRLSGGSIDELATAKAFQRMQRIRGRRSQG